MIYQFGHVKYYMDLQHNQVIVDKKVFKEFEADDHTEAASIAGSLFDAGLAQEHPLPDVDEWIWKFWPKG